MDPAAASAPVVPAKDTELIEPRLRSNETASSSSSPSSKGIPRVIIFFGPPCSGKTEYFTSKLSRDYTRISPSEDFRRNRKCSLHQVLANALKLLEADKNLVFDDCNEYRRTRESIVKEIRSKFPMIEFKCICFFPVGGLLQCQWANEWALAERAHYLSAKGSPLQEAKSLYSPPEAANLAMWFTGMKLPVKEEGFTYIEDVKLPIYARMTRPWTNVALFVEVKTLFEFTRSEQLVNVPREWSHLRDWHELNPSGRLIILVDEVDFYPMTLELLHDEPETLLTKVANFREMLKQAITKLAAEIQRPVYYLVSEYAPMEARGSFFRPPNPGMIAWLQFRHGLDLSNCLYVSAQSSSKLLTIPHAGGVTHISAEHFFASSGWTLASKVRKYAVANATALPAFLAHIEFTPTIPRATSISSSSADNATEPTVEVKPLFKHFHRLRGEAHMAVPAEEEIYTRRHGLFVPESGSPANSKLVPWTVNDLHNALDEELLEEAELYARSARVIRRTVDGTRLRGLIATSDDDKTGVSVSYNVAEKCEPPRRECSCNAVFDCEHIVALLMAWVDDPSSFGPLQHKAPPPLPAAAAGTLAAPRKLPEWMEGSESQGEVKRARTEERKVLASQQKDGENISDEF